MTEQTIVHLMRHGEVPNPDKILYGRLPGFVLSDLGHEMADRWQNTIKDRDIVEIWASPLERARQTAAPTAAAKALDILTDDRIIEADNVFEGERVSVGDGVLRQPKAWRYLATPSRHRGVSHTKGRRSDEECCRFGAGPLVATRFCCRSATNFRCGFRG